MRSALGAVKQARQRCSLFSRVLSNIQASTSNCGLQIETPQDSSTTDAQESCSAFLGGRDLQAPLLMGRGDIRTKKGKIFRGTFGKSRPKKLKDPHAPKAWWHQSETAQSFPVPIPHPPRPSPVHDPNEQPPASLQVLAILQQWMHDQGLHPSMWSQRHTLMAL